MKQCGHATIAGVCPICKRDAELATLRAALAMTGPQHVLKLRAAIQAFLDKIEQRMVHTLPGKPSLKEALTKIRSLNVETDEIVALIEALEVE